MAKYHATVRMESPAPQWMRSPDQPNPGFTMFSVDVEFETECKRRRAIDGKARVEAERLHPEARAIFTSHCRRVTD